MQRTDQHPDSFSRPAVFLDRDGTLIEDVGVLHSIEQIELYSDTVEALRQLQKNYVLFVITNQSGIARGEVRADRVDRVNGHLDEMLRREGIVIQEWYVCPHRREEGCGCIKPKPEFMLRAQSDYGIDLARSFVVGDHPHDVFTGSEQGVFGLYLLTGHGSRHLSDLPGDKLVFHRISDAADWIGAHPNPVQCLDLKIEEAAGAIRNGGVAAFPTETVYGLGADVFQPEAVDWVFRIKGRPHYNPLIAHIADRNQLQDLVPSVPAPALRLMEAFWPGPLAIVLPKRKEVPDMVTGGKGSIAIRMPENPIALKLIRSCATPIAAPSANAFTCTSPTTAQHVKDQLGSQCEVIIDGGACRVGVESTVISFTGALPVVLRPGGVTVEEIEQLIGNVEVLSSPSEKEEAAESPGLMSNHYAPATKLVAFAEIPAAYADQSDIGLLLFAPPESKYAGVVEVLSKSGNTKEAAANFFAALRRLDALGLREIIAEYVPEAGLGHAINNRLSKAAMGRVSHDK
jgi:L-threonylcarbamoyladenylate synthase